jgi:YjbE family integral membrane protein
MLAFLADAGTVTQIAQIVLIDLLLAGDNAIVIAMAVRSLPPREQALGRIWGTMGAVALRVVFLAIAQWLLAIPWLQFVGGLLLLWIGWKLLVPDPHRHEATGETEASKEPEIRAGDSLRAAIWIIIVADASMSLDNVIAVTGAAEGHLGLAIGGIALSIPIVVWGSKLLSAVMARHRWVVWIGGGILGHVGGVLMVVEPEIIAIFGKPEHPGWHPLALALGIGFTVLGWWADRRYRRAAATSRPTG